MRVLAFRAITWTVFGLQSVSLLVRAIPESLIAR